MEYLVTWRIDIEADEPIQAALEALRILRDDEATALDFTVGDKAGNEFDVDLYDLRCKKKGG